MGDRKGEDSGRWGGVDRAMVKRRGERWRRVWVGGDGNGEVGGGDGSGGKRWNGGGERRGRQWWEEMGWRWREEGTAVVGIEEKGGG